MNYLMEAAAQQIKDEIQDLQDVLQTLYAANVSLTNKGYLLLTDRLNKLLNELKTYEE